MTTTAPRAPSPGIATGRAPNGLTLTATALNTVPLIQARLALRLDFDTPADLAASDVLAASWSQHPATARLEQVGGTVSVNRKRRWLLLTVQATADRQQLLADTLAELTAAAYNPSMLETAVSKVTQQAALAASQPAVDAARQMWAHYYDGTLPPAADPSPPADAAARITLNDITAAHARYVTPRHAHLAIVGAIDTSQCLAAFAAALAPWQHTTPATAPTPLAAPTTTPTIATRHRPGQQQTQIRLVAPAQPRTGIHAFAANQIAAAILGGSFSSRINTVLREQHGLAYRCRAATDYLDQDFFVIEVDVHTRHAQQAMHHLHDLTTTFAAHGPTEDELAAATGFITGAYTINLGSQSGRGSLLTAAITQDLPPSALTDVPRAVARTTLADIHAAAAHCQPTRFAGVVCGDATHFPDQWT
ncbi:insulinase family protein (plasmid) [Streptomyces sp. NBC_01558]|uniref:M16 family metallopeptidase n=1 Tax=Streptomyces sp. NBC_01558 TaxID=2975878 RepID=UPI002DDA4540|nr:insulinase family protein [Streptomyces sp. NBC_01558]WSD82736.1 insulinase family protein [Streptomyces sp. NBC_01558]